MGYKYDVALIIDQMLFQPSHGFCIKVVGRFVEQKNIRLFKQQTRKRDSTLLTTRKARHGAITWRATQSVHCKFKLAI